MDTGAQASTQTAQHRHGLRGQRAINVVVRGLLRTPGPASLLGRRLVVLSFMGRASGRRYAVPVAYLADGDDLLVGTSSGWKRNLRTGDVVPVRLKGRSRRARVTVCTARPDVVAAYGLMVRANPAFARLNGVRVVDGVPDEAALCRAWEAGAWAIRLTPLSD
ncbi:hypothetical protein [Xylanimonas sp. McL0601]|uniref:hypothetical protein n=1 Tax=Xylanimonas sp. McL0601 TaxID=3414739 RepID=UPI003CF87358